MTYCRRGEGAQVSALIAGACAMWLCMPGLSAPAATEGGGGLLDLSIEELLHLEVTSVSKKSQVVEDTAAAVFVITQDDIQRIGARSIPEALRLAPGLEVAQIDANKWAISARGFNGRFANKLLVLMDGRALYTPSFGGVFWDVQDTLMQDIERIEVIRGPGGALWGANAVNGVINIITRSSRDTEGGEVIGEYGVRGAGTGSVRFGAAPIESLSYRVYAKYSELGGNEDAQGMPTADHSHIGRVGMRTDWNPTAQDLLSLTAEGYTGASGETIMQSLIAPPYATITNADEDVSGQFVVGHWQRDFDPSRQLQAQFYYDHTDRTGPLFSEERQSFNLELQYQFPLGQRHDIVTGVAYRHNIYQFGTTATLAVTPSNPSDNSFNAFAQDEIQLISDRLALTLGVDIQHNPLSPDYLDALPSARLLWSVNDHNHLWTAVTKAISPPSYEATNASLENAQPIQPPRTGINPFPVPLATNFIPNPNSQSEELVAYELGYRTQFDPGFTLDTTLFLQQYTDLRVETTVAINCEPSNVSIIDDPACPASSDHVVNVIQFQNDVHGHSTGAEVAADWAVSSRLRLRAAYTYLNLVLTPGTPPEAAFYAPLAYITAYDAGESPKNQLYLRGDWSLSRALDADLAVRYVGELPSIPVSAYWTADANIVWHVTPRLDLSVIGRNLLQPAHEEFVSELRDVVPTQIVRTVAVRVRWGF
jgi:iron complex outermembrane receptor protein